MKTIILAAGVGSRLGSTIPKGLIKLPNDESILGRQIRILKSMNLDDITVVVGYKKEQIMTPFKNVKFRVNPDYDSTNTAKSLLCAIKKFNDDVLWMNGDIVYDEEIIALIKSQECNTAVVNIAVCGEEEVKYLTDERGNINAISKEIKKGRGEALGINLVIKESLKEFISALQECNNNDYFERAMQLAINNHIIIKPLDVSRFRCIEIDNKEDLKKARDLFR